jgi:hypothetical protein
MRLRFNHARPRNQKQLASPNGDAPHIETKRRTHTPI